MTKEKKDKVTKAVVAVAAGIAITVTVGKIIPMNLLHGSSGFSSNQIVSECCGPYHQHCSGFKGT